jgi:uncharacterized protein (TIGR02270 family)
LEQLARLDERLEAHLDGLRVAGKLGWDFMKKALEINEPGEVFVAAVLAFESGDERRVQDVLSIGMATFEAERGLISALGWLSYVQALKLINALLASSVPAHRRIGIAASAIHRRDPGPALQAALVSDDPLLKVRALRAAGELGLLDSHLAVRIKLNDEKPASRFWAAWSGALLRGDKDAVASLQSFVESGESFRERAVQLAVRRLPFIDARAWLSTLAKDGHQLRTAPIAAGALGDPEFIPWLIEQMKVPELARVAGEALSMLTGIDLVSEGLDREKPAGFEAGPTESPEDEGVDLDVDLDLPWPDHALIQEWWRDHRGDFRKGTRYLLGRPIEPEALRKVLKSGRQRQRAAAALELAILQPGRPLFEVRGPGFRQQRVLE